MTTLTARVPRRERSYMECGNCGQDCVESDEDGKFLDGQEATCDDCGAHNVASVDEDDAWVRWYCKHGVDDETTCPECDEEE